MATKRDLSDTGWQQESDGGVGQPTEILGRLANMLMDHPQVMVGILAVSGAIAVGLALGRRPKKKQDRAAALASAAASLTGFRGRKRPLFPAGDASRTGRMLEAYADLLPIGMRLLQNRLVRDVVLAAAIRAAVRRLGR